MVERLTALPLQDVAGNADSWLSKALDEIDTAANQEICIKNTFLERPSDMQSSHESSGIHWLADSTRTLTQEEENSLAEMSQTVKTAKGLMGKMLVYAGTWMDTSWRSVQEQIVDRLVEDQRIKKRIKCLCVPSKEGACCRAAKSSVRGPIEAEQLCDTLGCKFCHRRLCLMYYNVVNKGRSGSGAKSKNQARRVPHFQSLTNSKENGARMRGSDQISDDFLFAPGQCRIECCFVSGWLNPLQRVAEEIHNAREILESMSGNISAHVIQLQHIVARYTSFSLFDSSWWSKNAFSYLLACLHVCLSLSSFRSIRVLHIASDHRLLCGSSLNALRQYIDAASGNIWLLVLSSCSSIELGIGRNLLSSGRIKHLIHFAGMLDGGVAEQFSAMLYLLLLGGSTIKQAFDEAKREAPNCEVYLESNTKIECIQTRKATRKWLQILCKLTVAVVIVLAITVGMFSLDKDESMYMRVPEICNETTSFRLDSFSNIAYHSANLYDHTCNDTEKLRKWVSISRLLISHTVISWQKALTKWMKDTIGFHYIIKRNGDVVVLVSPPMKAYMAIGCYDHGDNPLCTGLRANDHSVGIMLEGNGCVQNFTPEQYHTFFWLVDDLKRRFKISNEHIHAISDIARPIGKHVAPCHFFDWHRVVRELPGVQLPRSWNGSSKEAKTTFARAIEQDPNSSSFRSKWQGFDEEGHLSECLTPGSGDQC